ncbi:MAG: fumarylacetoacetase [Burkholderiales bacterium]|nr:fumarylacetoacetase [Burkholderiales bacterium]
MTLNATHDPKLQSWVESANSSTTDFPIQNLPHGVFRRKASSESFRGGVAIGDMILDLPAACARGVFSDVSGEPAEAAGAATLNGLMALGPVAWSALRLRLSQLLRTGAVEADALRACLLPQAEAEYALPARIGDYTDFFTSYHHMVNAGRVFQPDAPPLPNFKWLPIAYHGRASSVEVSGASFHRPLGQTRAPGAAKPVFGPSRRVDYEMELGCWVGPGNRRGEPIAIDDAENHIFGVCLFNDWSARDVQGWESMPLGPFLAKNFLSTVSPWIVTLEALAPFRCAIPREAGDPPTLPHLNPADPNQAFDLQLEVWLHTASSGDTPMRLSRSNFRHCYWSLAQMVAHHTEGGCNLNPGDLLGTGTQSGPQPGEQGCLLELSLGGRQPVQLTNGETRSFLEDGDTVVLRAWGEKAGAARIGFGECSGTVLPARP